MQHQVIQAIDTAELNRGLRGADWVADPHNIAIIEAGDVVLFDYDSAGIYEIHVLLSSRGRKAVECVGRAFDEMFRDRGAEVIFGLVPEHRRQVALMARWCGMKFISKVSWLGDRVELFRITKEEWMRK